MSLFTFLSFSDGEQLVHVEEEELSLFEFKIVKTLEFLDLSIDNINHSENRQVWDEFRQKYKEKLNFFNYLAIDCQMNWKWFDVESVDEAVCIQVVKALCKRGGRVDCDSFYKMGGIEPVMKAHDFLPFMVRIFEEILQSDDKSKAVKYYLRPLKLLEDYWQGIPKDDGLLISNYLTGFVEILQQNEICSPLIIDLFELFRAGANVHFFETANHNVDFVLSCFQTLKYDVYNLWSHKQDEMCPLIEALDEDKELLPHESFRGKHSLTVCMMFNHFDICLLLLKYGVKNPTFHDNEGQLQQIVYRPFRFVSFDPEQQISNYNRISFLVCQVIILYFGSHLKTEAGRSCEKLLIKLWRSIDDVLLVEEDFLTTLNHFDERVRGGLEEVWPWYEENVWEERLSRRCPRSLRHLTRCTIREILEENFAIPRGVEKLPLSDDLKKYLLFKNKEEFSLAYGLALLKI